MKIYSILNGVRPDSESSLTPIEFRSESNPILAANVEAVDGHNLVKIQPRFDQRVAGDNPNEFTDSLDCNYRSSEEVVSGMHRRAHEKRPYIK